MSLRCATLGSRFELALQALGKSRKDVAKATETTVGFVGFVARGEKVPGGAFLGLLQKELDVSVDWLLNGTGRIFSSWAYLDEQETGRLTWQIWFAGLTGSPASWGQARKDVQASIRKGRARMLVQSRHLLRHPPPDLTLG